MTRRFSPSARAVKPMLASIADMSSREIGSPSKRATRDERHAIELTALVEQRQREARQVVGAKRMLEPRVCRARVYEVGEAELPNVSQSLENRRVDELKGQRVDTNVVPEWIPYDQGETGAAFWFTPLGQRQRLQARCCCRTFRSS